MANALKLLFFKDHFRPPWGVEILASSQQLLPQLSPKATHVSILLSANQLRIGTVQERAFAKCQTPTANGRFLSRTCLF